MRRCPGGVPGWHGKGSGQSDHGQGHGVGGVSNTQGHVGLEETLYSRDLCMEIAGAMKGREMATNHRLAVAWAYCGGGAHLTAGSPPPRTNRALGRPMRRWCLADTLLRLSYDELGEEP